MGANTQGEEVPFSEETPRCCLACQTFMGRSLVYNLYISKLEVKTILSWSHDVIFKPGHGLGPVARFFLNI